MTDESKSLSQIMGYFTGSLLDTIVTVFIGTWPSFAFWKSLELSTKKHSRHFVIPFRMHTTPRYLRPCSLPSEKDYMISLLRSQPNNSASR